MEPNEVSAIPEDFAQLWAMNPLAREQLHNIILSRLLRAAEMKLAENASKSSPS